MKDDGKREIRFVLLIALLLILAAALYIGVFFFAPIPVPLKILIAVIYTAIAGVIIYVARSRIKELKGDEYDDLSKY